MLTIISNGHKPTYYFLSGVHSSIPGMCSAGRVEKAAGQFEATAGLPGVFVTVKEGTIEGRAGRAARTPPTKEEEI